MVGDIKGTKLKRKIKLLHDLEVVVEEVGLRDLYIDPDANVFVLRWYHKLVNRISGLFDRVVFIEPGMIVRTKWFKMGKPTGYEILRTYINKTPPTYTEQKDFTPREKEFLFTTLWMVVGIGILIFILVK